MQNWDDLKFCLALFRHGTMSSAAQALGTNVATVSRRIDRLTEAMGETLFVKRDKSWEPTATCRALVDVARSTEEHINGVEASVSQEPELGAVLRLNCDVTILQCISIQRIRDFLDENPGINLDMTFRPKSLAYAETDVAVGYEEPDEGRIMRKRIGTFTLRPYVHRKFQKNALGWVSVNYGSRQHVVDQPMLFEFGRKPRVFSEGLNVTGSLMADTPLVAMLPTVYAERHPEFELWGMSDYSVEFPIWLSYHSSRRLDPIVRTGVDLVQTCFEGSPGWTEMQR